jgi:UDP-glucose 4-epimerase
MRVLVTGGAGYIGSHAVRGLLRAGHEAVVVDNLFRGHREAVPEGVRLAEFDVRSTDALSDLLVDERIECVMHFAALAYVGESVSEPLRYYDNNAGGTLSVLRAMDRARVRRLVFSSTCATYGEPEKMPIHEEMPQQPINPYGWAKLISERMLRDYGASQPEFRAAALRYFNVAGCARDGSAGEDHDPETHLIPVILQAALGVRDRVTVFGDDYPTPDGTCVRDYIHVEDLVAAHVRVMEALEPGDFRYYNLGIGRGYSVKQIIDAARNVIGRPVEVVQGQRRPGDPPELYAVADKIESELGWRAEVTDVEAIIDSAWRWFREHPRGYSRESS